MQDRTLRARMERMITAAKKEYSKWERSREGFCLLHKTFMTPQRDAKGEYYAHELPASGRLCHGGTRRIDPRVF